MMQHLSSDQVGSASEQHSETKRRIATILSVIAKVPAIDDVPNQVEPESAMPVRLYQEALD